MNKSLRWTSVSLLLPLLVVAVLVRSGSIPVVGQMMQDEALYAWYAHLIHVNPALIFSRELIEYHPPLLAVLLQPGHWLSPPEVGYRLISMMINVLGVVAIFLLGNRIGGRFLGIFAAIALTVLPFYVFYSNLITTDIPLGVFLMFFLFAVLSRSQEKCSVKRDIVIGILGASCIGVKWAGLIVIPILVLSSLFAEQGTCAQRLRTIKLPFIILLVFLSALFILNYFQMQYLVPHSALHTYLDGAYFKDPLWDFIKSFLLVAFNNAVLLNFSFFYGLMMLLFSKKREDVLLLVWFWVCLVSISLCQEKDIRYSLLIIPSSILISGRGLQILLSKIYPSRLMMARACQGVFILSFLVISLWDIYRPGNPIGQRMQFYRGFFEAGQWIREQATPDTTIVAASVRQIRYYTGIQYAESGGQIYFPPEQRDDFEKWLGQVPGKVILVSDAWEQTQPDWILPLRKNYDYLYGLGFRLATTVRDGVDGDLENVIWIYSRDRGV